MIRKEFRALLPAWGACAVALMAAATHSDLMRAFGPPIYFIGAASLGAMSIGHEYSHRTIGLLLSQPVARQRVLLTKLGVLATLLAALMAVAWATVPLGRGDAPFGTAFLCLPPLAALFLTPWLTLASRSPVAGTVFTLSIAGIVLVAGEWIGVARYGYSRDGDPFRVAMLWWSMIALCAVGAVMTWRLFLRLQAIDGGGTEVDFAPRLRVRARGLTKRDAGWLLVRKELRIQQLALAVAGLYVLAYLAGAFSRAAPPRFEDAAIVLTLCYGALLAVLIGSMASAEERNWRTLDSQLLLPMRSSRQWLIKTAVALGLAFVLGLALPVALITIMPPDPLLTSRFARQLIAPNTVVMLAALTVLSLYVSTLCSSGLWALMLSGPAAFAVGAFVLQLGGIMEGVLLSLDGRPDWRVVQRSAGLLTVVVMAIVLRLALANHRSSDRGGWRTAAQVAVVAAAMAVAVTIVGLAGALSR